MYYEPQTGSIRIMNKAFRKYAFMELMYIKNKQILK